MDINKDNKLDIVAGGAEGFVYLMTAVENGQFTNPKRLKDKNDQEIHLGTFFNEKIKKFDEDLSHQHKDACLHSVAVDWDNDGDLDLLLSGHGGLIAVRINEGTPDNASYASKNTYIMLDDKVFSTGKGTNARFVDWDGDGLKDLICGVTKTGVIWLKNKGSENTPAFENPQLLTNANKDNPYSPYANITVEVVDLNDDGKKDLLVGAITSFQEEKIWIYYQK